MTVELAIALFGILATLVGGTVWITSQLGGIRERLVRIETRMGIDDDDSQAGHAMRVR